ncbi:hypothetical protein H8S90_13945 [Olivibacter sp. SDN3]|uniref:hypothetical protein n=1 Tax=Olivibacter sp. SDN3 TaxID=2764720 RepID=UPI00165104E0|nr:hypothetical protein [Olivibacter sp. SDN3]QNL47920.1 hypothetical protein H8S90_13945 [Olivibacter sp. SDN3]
MRIAKADRPEEILADLKIMGAGGEWQEVETGLRNSLVGVHDLQISLLEGDPLEIDWLSFQ